MSALELKLARVGRGVKQLELSRLTKIEPSRLSKIENGWIEPRPDELAAIHAALGLDKDASAEETRAR